MPELPDGGTANSVSGDVYGTVVQARNIETLTMVLEQKEEPKIPRDLREAHPCFVDRVDACEEMRAELDSARLAKLLVYGPPGSGRLELAKKVLANRFPDGELLIDLSGAARDDTVHLDTVLHSALTELGMPADQVPASLKAKQQAFRSRITPRRMAITLRGISSASQAEPFRVDSPGSALVVLASAKLGRLINDRFKVIQLTALTEDDALTLFRDLAPDSSIVDTSIVEAGVRACGGSPLVVHLLAAQVNERPERAERVLRRFVKLGAPSLSEDARDMMRERLDVLRDSLPEDVAAGYCKLGLHPGTRLTVAAATALFGADEEGATDLLDELARYHLVSEDGGCYRIDSVILWHAQNSAKQGLSEKDRFATAARSVNHYLQDTVDLDGKLSKRPRIGPRYDAKAVLAGHQERKAILAKLETNRATLLGVVLLAEEYHLDEQTWQLCEALWGLYHLHGHHEDWRRTHELGLKAAERLGHQAAIMRMASQLASAHIAMGEYDRAEELFTKSLEAAHHVSDRTGEQSALEWLGKIAARRRDGAKAEEFYDRSWEAALLAPEAERPRMFALIELQRARLFLEMKRFEDSLKHAALVSEYFQTMSESDNKAKVLLVQGKALAGLRRDQEAEKALFAALDIFVADGSKRSQLTVLTPLLEVAERLGHTEIAENCRKAVRQLSVDLGEE